MAESTRRALLRGTPAFLGALAGCDAFTGERRTTTTAPPPEEDVEGGTTVAPARTLELQNRSGVDQFVSLAVRRGDDVVSSTTVELPLDTRRTFTLPARTGVLEVDLETTTGLTASHPWVVGDQLGELSVTLTSDEVRFAQRAWCTPACEPLSKGGSTAEFPYYGGPVFMTSYYGANVVIENTTTDTISVDLQIAHDGDTILDYAYTVPADVTLEFPGVHSAGDYMVRLQSDVGELKYHWRPPKERRLQLRLTEDAVNATCGQTTASLILRNDDTTVHRLDVTATRPDDDRRVFDGRYIVHPGANYRERGVLTGSGQYELRVQTDEGYTTTYDWWLCPPRGPTEITIQPNGRVHVLQYQPGE